MRLIRRNTFETNSSSTHSITMCTESDFDKWKNGELYYNSDDGMFYNNEERNKLIKKRIIYNKATYNNGTYTYKDVTVNDIDELYTEENIDEITDEDVENYIEEDFEYYDLPVSYEEWLSFYGDAYAQFKSSYTTDSGEKIIAFGYYGYN